MAQIMKHVGKLGEKPCVVVLRELPDEPENCLIVPTHGLENRHHDDLMSVIQSAEAQESNDVSQVLARRQFTDGTNMLNYLHNNKKIQKVSVAQVNLTPAPGTSIALSEVNAEIRKIQGGYVPPKNDAAHLSQSQPASAQTEDKAEPSHAQSLLFQANLMKEDAQRMLAEAEQKLAEAYKLDPSLQPQPKKTSRTKKSDSDK